jgi:hypothetical protein
MKANLKEIKFCTCIFIQMDYLIEVVVSCYLKGLNFLIDIML